MPLESETPISSVEINLEDIRKYYFEHAKRTLKIDDAKYLLERAQELGLNQLNGGVKALFNTLKYNFDE